MSTPADAVVRAVTIAAAAVGAPVVAATGMAATGMARAGPFRCEYRHRPRSLFGMLAFVLGAVSGYAVAASTVWSGYAVAALTVWTVVGSAAARAGLVLRGMLGFS